MSAELATPILQETVGSEKILVVDDDVNVRDTITEMLKIGGHRCAGVASVAEAESELRSSAYDLVITDMHMPGESGLDLIERVRKLDDSIPVILVTGYPSINSAINAMKRGAIEFITKPFDFDSITQVVTKALRERRLRQEIRRLQEDAHKAEVIERLNRQLNDRVDELTRLYTISEAMTQFLDTDALYNQVVKLAAQVTGAQRVSLMMLDRTRRHLKIRASMGVPDEIISRTKIKVGDSISGKVVLSGKSIRATRHIHQTFESGRESLGLGHYASQSWLSLPLAIAGQVLGVLNLTDKPDRADFTLGEEQIMQVLVEKAGSKLENQALYEGIYANLVDTLTSLVTTLEAKDPYTRQHSYRVTEYALRIGDALKIGEEEQEMVEFAALLHDIGKIGVRDQILTKPGKLTDEEYEAIKQHPTIGEKIVDPLGLTAPERAIIRNHHEWFNGTGYPDRLSGDQIPWLARIVTVADAYDAMTSSRPYRKALSPAEAMAEIKRLRGQQFDPNAADAARAIIEAGNMRPRAYDTNG